ncbi:Pre-rRNA-processing protein ipi1 [Penicillium atrosanguineum]|uniref:SAGA-associated factor 11 n=1 Tax=Penicillium atrosanguineum TaxID=1132637 RepID=A0A9W9U647_9EURO|nr:Pre-rRNA-processing protein ipi1 [Penicillium atrosanguineum]KAJ5141590.1 hypothetical protein N7526_002585 [Penicillium atrosanguineum]KAJ5298183.1 Pre-rRNA-processing protein ipi1 [Penicillium atrosanguineum]KAJ5321551.1 hypothetical protein N7476_004553 [Penicillium atrosanguineum]
MADSTSRPSYPAGTIAKVSTDILNETFHNIIHDLVAKVHREEKMARMRSAVVIARQKAEEGATVPEEPGSKSVVDGKPREVIIDANKLASTHLETDAAIFDRGKVLLKGNPLHTVKEIICPDCRLPRLSYPPVGAGHRPPPDPNREYCQNGPLITLPGHDVHGKMFAVMPNPKKRKTEKDSTIPEVPTSKCPICPRYFVMNRVAQHLDRCMNISGRGSSTRNKTPTDSGASGASSPTSSAPKRPHNDDDDGSPSPTKKKKLNSSKKGSMNKPGPSKLKQSFTAEDDDDVKSENGD